MDTGWIYILTNASMQGMVKVGLTTTSPEQRLRELSSATGVATPFTLRHAFQVVDVKAAEAKSHRVLEKVYGRPNKSREFFAATADEALELLTAALSEFFVDGENLALREAEKQVKLKAFTMACMQFEAELPRVMANGSGMSAKLAAYYGSYIAACAALDRTPLFRNELSGRYSEAILEKAISIASEFTNDPEELLIDFCRSYRN